MASKGVSHYACKHSNTRICRICIYSSFLARRSKLSRICPVARISLITSTCTRNTHTHKTVNYFDATFSQACRAAARQPESVTVLSARVCSCECNQLLLERNHLLLMCLPRSSYRWLCVCVLIDRYFEVMMRWFWAYHTHESIGGFGCVCVCLCSQSLGIRFTVWNRRRTPF